MDLETIVPFALPRYCAICPSLFLNAASVMTLYDPETTHLERYEDRGYNAFLEYAQRLDAPDVWGAINGIHITTMRAVTMIGGTLTCPLHIQDVLDLLRKRRY